MYRETEKRFHFFLLGGQSGGMGANCGLHPLIHTSATSEFSTKYCSWVSKVKVWIKVCNMQFNSMLLGLHMPSHYNLN